MLRGLCLLAHPLQADEYDHNRHDGNRQRQECAHDRDFSGAPAGGVQTVNKGANGDERHDGDYSAEHTLYNSSYHVFSLIRLTASVPLDYITYLNARSLAGESLTLLPHIDLAAFGDAVLAAAFPCAKLSFLLSHRYPPSS